MSGELTPEQRIKFRHLLGGINVTAASRDFDPFSSDSEKLTRIANAIAILSGDMEPPWTAEETLTPGCLDVIRTWIAADKEGNLRDDGVLD